MKYKFLVLILSLVLIGCQSKQYNIKFDSNGNFLLSGGEEMIISSTLNELHSKEPKFADNEISKFFLGWEYNGELVNLEELEVKDSNEEIVLVAQWDEIGIVKHKSIGTVSKLNNLISILFEKRAYQDFEIDQTSKTLQFSLYFTDLNYRTIISENLISGKYKSEINHLLSLVSIVESSLIESNRTDYSVSLSIVDPENVSRSIYMSLDNEIEYSYFSN